MTVVGSIYFLKALKNEGFGVTTLEGIYDTLLAGELPTTVRGWSIFFSVYSDTGLKAGDLLEVRFDHPSVRLESIRLSLPDDLNPYFRYRMQVSLPSLTFNEDGVLTATLLLNGERVARIDLEVKEARE